MMDILITYPDLLSRLPGFLYHHFEVQQQMSSCLVVLHTVQWDALRFELQDAPSAAQLAALHQQLSAYQSLAKI